MIEILRKLPVAERRLLLGVIRSGVKMHLFELDVEADHLWRHKMFPLYRRYASLRPYLYHSYLVPDRWKMLEMMKNWVAELETMCKELETSKE